MRAIAIPRDRQAKTHATAIQARAGGMPLPVRALPLGAILRQSLAWWAAIRGAYFALMLLVVGVVEHQTLSIHALLQSWLHWDAGWYLYIAQVGYNKPETAGFFPLYPALIALVAHLPGLSPLDAALLVANVASLVACCGVALLAATEAGTPRVVPWTLAALAAYPVAYFLVAPFSEGLFLALAVFALLAARQRRWRVAALCAFLAALTRSTGVALAPALLWEYGRQQGWWAGLRRWRQLPWAALRRRVLTSGVFTGHMAARLAEGALVVAAVPAALACVVLFDWWRFGDPLLYLHAESRYWYHVQAPVWETLAHMAGSLIWPPRDMWSRLVVTLDASAVVMVGAALVAGIRRLPVAFLLYGLVVLYLPLSTPIPGRPDIAPSIARYLLVALPLFLLAGRFATRHRRLGLVLLAGAFIVQALLAEFFLMGVWME